MHGADLPGRLPDRDAGRARSCSGVTSQGKGHLAPALLGAPPEQGRRKVWVGDRTRTLFLSMGLLKLELSPESLGGLVKKPDCCSRGSAPKVSNLKVLGWALESAFLTISPVNMGAPALGPPAFGKHDSRC